MLWARQKPPPATWTQDPIFLLEFTPGLHPEQKGRGSNRGRFRPGTWRVTVQQQLPMIRSPMAACNLPTPDQSEPTTLPLSTALSRNIAAFLVHAKTLIPARVRDRPSTRGASQSTPVITEWSTLALKLPGLTRPEPEGIRRHHARLTRIAICISFGRKRRDGRPCCLREEGLRLFERFVANGQGWAGALARSLGGSCPHLPTRSTSQDPPACTYAASHRPATARSTVHCAPLPRPQFAI